MEKSKGRVGRPPRQGSAATHDDIRAAAREHFSQTGYAATSLRDIARAAGVDIKTLYYHCGTKRELLESVIAEVRSEFAGQVRTWLQETEGLRGAEAVERMFRRYFDYLLAHPEVAKLGAHSMLSYGEGGESFDLAYMQDFLASMRRLYAKREGTLPPTDFDARMVTLASAAQMVSASLSYHDRVLGADGDIEALRRAFLAGLGPLSRVPRNRKS